MPLVLGDNVWVGGTTFLEKGTRQGDIAAGLSAQIGSHLWVDEGVRPNVSPSGEALTGLRDNVFVDGVLYEKGSTPDAPAVIAKIGDHMWVDGRPATSEPGGDSDGDGAGAAGGDGSLPTPDATKPPPRSGKGSSVAAWLAYAQANGVGVPADAQRDEIIAALSEAGTPTE